MISIIICSRTPEISPALSQNIEKTIGSAYELIVIDNSENKYSIFEAYNLGIQKSKGDFWCFMHDDIIFHTLNWGLKLIKIFESDIKIGLIGVAGAKIKTKMPSAWWDCPEDQKVIYILQHIKNNTIEKWEVGWQNNSEEEVSVIDGVFMLGRKDKSIAFDDRLKGFHNYDLNLSLAYKKANYKVVVSKEILLEHFSSGTINKEWYLSTIQFDKYYSNFLPSQISKDRIKLKTLEFENGKRFCNYLLENEYKKEAFYYGLKMIALRPNSDFHKPFFKSLFKKVMERLKNKIRSNK